MLLKFRHCFALIMAAAIAIAPITATINGSFPLSIPKAEAGLIKKYLEGYIVKSIIEREEGAAVDFLVKKLANPKTAQSTIRELMTFAEENPNVAAKIEGIVEKAESIVTKAKNRNGVPYNPRIWRDKLYDTFGSENVETRTMTRPSDLNAKLAGKGKSVGNDEVPFTERGLPTFDKYTKFDTRIPDYDPAAGRETHFKQATKALREAINRGEVDANQFSKEQLEAIEKGKGQIPDLTWHHHEDLGRVQLVPKNLHKGVAHLGGFSLHK